MTRVEQIGDATLMLGDCLEILPSISEADVAVTDPPYGIDAAEWDTEVPLWALPLIRAALKHGGACYWFGVPPNVWTVALAGELDFRREIVWWHATGYPAKSNYRLTTETVLFMTAGEPAYFDADAIREEYEPRPERPSGRPDRQNPKGKSPGNVMRFARPAPRHDDEAEHPHAKPTGLLRRFVLASCPPRGVVLDPFMGSGTTGVACARLGRRFIGIEKDPRWFDLACRRIEQAYRQADLFVPAPKPKPKQLMLGGAE